MMFENIKYNKDTVDDMIDTGKYLKEANQTRQEAMKHFDMDEFQDNIDDMQDLANEQQEIGDLMNDNFNIDIDDDLEDELANLETELEV